MISCLSSALHGTQELSKNESAFSKDSLGMVGGKNASCIYASFNISLFYSAPMPGGLSAPKVILKLHLPSDVRGVWR